MQKDSSDTPDSQPRKKWSKTQYTNLWRYLPSGVYFCHAKVRGRLVRASLKTKSLEIAKVKLDALLSSERAKAPLLDENWTCKQLIEAYREEINSNYLLQPRSKEYRLETVEIIQKTWPELDAMKPRKVSERAVKEWSQKLAGKYSASRFNGVIESLRGIFRLGMSMGVLGENVAMQIKRQKVLMAPPKLPDSAQFKKLLAALDKRKKRRYAAPLVRFLAYTGMRVGAVEKLTRENIDLNRGEIILPPVKHQKIPIRIPMIGEMRALAKQLLKNHSGHGPLFSIKNPKQALMFACKELGMPRLTPRGLRHLFATSCLESGVDVRAVAGWLGHKDGGALLLKRYAHLRNDHSQRMARRVKF